MTIERIHIRARSLWVPTSTVAGLRAPSGGEESVVGSMRDGQDVFPHAKVLAEMRLGELRETPRLSRDGTENRTIFW